MVGCLRYCRWWEGSPKGQWTEQQPTGPKVDDTTGSGNGDVGFWPWPVLGVEDEEDEDGEGRRGR